MENGSPRATQRVWGERTSTESRLSNLMALRSRVPRSRERRHACLRGRRAICNSHSHSIRTFQFRGGLENRRLWLSFVRCARCLALLRNPERGKLDIQKRITKLVLTPKETPEGRRLKVTGDVALFVEDGVMEESALEGIGQHYTLPRIELVLRAVVAACGPLGPKIDPIDLYPHQYATEWAILDQVANRFRRIR